MAESTHKAKSPEPVPEFLPDSSPYTFSLSRRLLARLQTYATIRNIPLETALNAALEVGLTRLGQGLGIDRNYSLLKEGGVGSRAAP